MVRDKDVVTSSCFAALSAFARIDQTMKKCFLFVLIGLLSACSTTDERALEPTTSTIPIWTGQFWLYIPVQSPVTLASRDADIEAKKFLPVTDKAVLYIYRDQFMGSAWQIPITVNGVLIGNTGGFTFFRKTLSPGEYVVESWGEDLTQIELNLEAGKIYYVRHKTRTGFATIHAELHLVDETTGREGVKQSKLLLGEVQM
jgi:hypothetical protein